MYQVGENGECIVVGDGRQQESLELDFAQQHNIDRVIWLIENAI